MPHLYGLRHTPDLQYHTYLRNNPRVLSHALIATPLSLIIVAIHHTHEKVQIRPLNGGTNSRENVSATIKTAV
jgi:hypothetical protein